MTYQRIDGCDSCGRHILHTEECPVEVGYRLAAAAIAALADNLEQPVACATCHGQRYVTRPGWSCGCGAYVKHMRDCGKPAPMIPCAACNPPLVARFGPGHPEWCEIGSDDTHGHCGHWYDCEPCCACGDDTPSTECDCPRCTAFFAEPDDGFRAVVHAAMMVAMQGDSTMPSAYSDRVAVALADLGVGVAFPRADLKPYVDAVHAADAELERAYELRLHAGKAYQATEDTRVELAEAYLKVEGTS